MTKNRKSCRSVFAHFGDTHCGLENGLIAPDTNVPRSSHEERVIQWEGMSNWSQWLWKTVWLPSIDAAQKFAGGDPLYLCIGGDMAHGSRFVEHLYTPIVDQQVSIFVKSMQPWRKCETLTGIYMVYGTGAHDFGENTASRQIYDKLAPWGYDMAVDDHLDVISPDGMHIDISHHGPGAGQPHTRGNVARRYAQNKMTAFLKRGQRIPGLIQRGHVHVDVSVPVELQWIDKYYYTHIIITPPMCGPNGYARQASRSVDRSRCGMFLSESIDGKLGRVVPLIYEREMRRTIKARGVRFYKKPKRKKKK